jgi:hypothetical protein
MEAYTEFGAKIRKDSARKKSQTIRKDKHIAPESDV